MISDLKWLVEIINSGGKITTGIVVACGLFLLTVHWGRITPIEPWMILLATTGLFLFGSLSIVAIFGSYPVQNYIVHRITIYKQKRAVRDYIPYMTGKEREIISYLLAKKEKTFFYTIDGGYAATLISRGIVVCALRPGQAGSTWHIPFKIPDHIWSVLWEHKNEFPYKPPPPDKTEVHPWSISWMVR